VLDKKSAFVYDDPGRTIVPRVKGEMFPMILDPDITTLIEEILMKLNPISMLVVYFSPFSFCKNYFSLS